LLSIVPRLRDGGTAQAEGGRATPPPTERGRSTTWGSWPATGSCAARAGGRTAGQSRLERASRLISRPRINPT
jgi:hypothetical protein